MLTVKSMIAAAIQSYFNVIVVGTSLTRPTSIKSFSIGLAIYLGFRFITSLVMIIAIVDLTLEIRRGRRGV